MPDFQFHLGSFNAHWENKIHLTENQKTRKFAAWLVQEFEKQQAKADREVKKPTRKQSSEKPNNRNVNDPWGDVQNYGPATGDVDNPFREILHKRDALSFCILLTAIRYQVFSEATVRMTGWKFCALEVFFTNHRIHSVVMFCLSFVKRFR